MSMIVLKTSEPDFRFFLFFFVGFFFFFFFFFLLLIFFLGEASFFTIFDVSIYISRKFNLTK